MKCQWESGHGPTSVHAQLIVIVNGSSVNFFSFYHSSSLSHWQLLTHNGHCSFSMLNYDHKHCNLRNPITIELCVVCILTISDFFFALSISLSLSVPMLWYCYSVVHPILSTINWLLLKIRKIFLSMGSDFHTPGEKKTPRIFRKRRDSLLSQIIIERSDLFMLLSYLSLVSIITIITDFGSDIVRRHSFHLRSMECFHKISD